MLGGRGGGTTEYSYTRYWIGTPSYVGYGCATSGYAVNVVTTGLNIAPAYSFGLGPSYTAARTGPSSTTTSSSIPQASQTSSSSGTSVGVIVGPVISGVAVIVAAFIAAWFIRKRAREREEFDRQLAERREQFEREQAARNENNHLELRQMGFA